MGDQQGAHHPSRPPSPRLAPVPSEFYGDQEMGAGGGAYALKIFWSGVASNAIEITMPDH